MYNIYYQDKFVFSIDNGLVNIISPKYMPFDIYLEENDDIDTRVNNQTNFNAWCAGRILPLDREYAKEILNYFGYNQSLTDKERAKIAIATRCLSINDCFWLKSESEELTWKDVNLFENSLQDGIFETALTGKSITVTNKELVTPDISTDGVAPKAWLRKNNEFYLLKGDKNDSVVKETEASQILFDLGFKNAGYKISDFKGSPVSTTECFTNQSVNFVKAEWFNIWCMNNYCSIKDFIDEDEFDKMNLADYLIGNNDEHSYNWGFLYDNEMNILSLNPMMDFDHAFESTDESPCLPEKLLGNNITQKNNAINIVRRHPDWIKKDVDLSKYKYGEYVSQRLNLLL